MHAGPYSDHDHDSMSLCIEDESQDLESLEACSQTAAISTLGMHSEVPV